MQTARDIYNELRHVQKQLESGSRPKPGSGSARAAVVDSLWLAVLPFTTRGADEDARTLADGLTEDITAGLARFPYLSVVAEHSARQHKDTTADVRQIGRVLGARYILDGGVRRGGTSIRITARLVDAGSGAQLWSETYTREPAQGNLLAVQDNVTDRLVATVADVHGVLLRSASAGVRGIPIEQLTPEELRLRYDRDGSVDTFAIQDEIGDRVAATLADEGGALYRLFAAAVKATTDAEHDALRLFVRFAEFVEHFTREQHGRLRDEYQALVEHQPLNATAWAHLAILYGLEVFFGFNPLPDPVARVRRAAEPAVAIDSTNQGAWYALADAAFFERNAAAFRSAADRTIELNPLHCRTVGAIGLLRAFAGDPTEGAAFVTGRSRSIHDIRAGFTSHSSSTPSNGVTRTGRSGRLPWSTCRTSRLTAGCSPSPRPDDSDAHRRRRRPSTNCGVTTRTCWMRVGPARSGRSGSGTASCSTAWWTVLRWR